jgi:hypothetical protein
LRYINCNSVPGGRMGKTVSNWKSRSAYMLAEEVLAEEALIVHQQRETPCCVRISIAGGQRARCGRLISLEHCSLPRHPQADVFPLISLTEPAPQVWPAHSPHLSQ